jgi:hypothetical protein
MSLILLVEDEEDILDLVEYHLKQSGFQGRPHVGDVREILTFDSGCDICESCHDKHGLTCLAHFTTLLSGALKRSSSLEMMMTETILSSDLEVYSWRHPRPALHGH